MLFPRWCVMSRLFLQGVLRVSFGNADFMTTRCAAKSPCVKLPGTLFSIRLERAWYREWGTIRIGMQLGCPEIKYLKSRVFVVLGPRQIARPPGDWRVTPCCACRRESPGGPGSYKSRRRPHRISRGPSCITQAKLHYTGQAALHRPSCIAQARRKPHT